MRSQKFRENILKNKNIFKMLIGEASLRLITEINYAILPVFIMTIYNEFIAGIFMAIANSIQAFILNPISGSLADRNGTKPLMIIGSIVLIIGSLIMSFMPLSLGSVIIFTVSLFFYYALRNTETYILRMAQKNKGGLIFGVSENIFSISYFLTTIFIPFFLINDMYKVATLIVSVVATINLFIIFTIKNDNVFLGAGNKSKGSIFSSISPLKSIKSGINFVKVNNNYPLMTLSGATFQGVFYGSIWFLIPIQIVNVGFSGFYDGLQLGIYEIVTIFLATYSGYLADKYNWRHLHSFGWCLVVIGVLFLPFYSFPLGLIIIGAIIALGNNLFWFAAEHALEKYDIDHEEDGEFISLKTMMSNLGYAISPLVCGFLYKVYGFSVALLFASVVCSIIGVWMIYLTFESEKKDIIAERI